MFYEKQPKDQQDNYKRMLEIIGNLTLLFSESDCPYLPYRAHENIFCKYFYAANLGRKDCSADAQKGKIGIGLKTWMGNDDQKVAEFGKLREEYKTLTGIELVKKISEYRNERIRITKNLYNIDEMVYHIVKRVPGAMEILEHSFDYIDINNISIIKERGNQNNTYFTDGKHTYHFSVSKNTLYMIFTDLELLDKFNVSIMADPYNYLMKLRKPEHSIKIDSPDARFTYTIDMDGLFNSKVIPRIEQLCLRLYATKKGKKYVPEKSGLNQWNASGRKRDPNEIYIAYLKEDRERNKNFFPGRDTIFELTLPDGTIVPAKVCQDAGTGNPNEGKAIMSNPNKVLGEWLLRKVFELPEKTLVTYDMLQKFGIDSVIFTKHDESHYSIDFAEIGTYEEFYGDETALENTKNNC